MKKINVYNKKGVSNDIIHEVPNDKKERDVTLLIRYMEINTISS